MQSILFLLLLFGVSWISCQPTLPTPPGPPTIPGIGSTTPTPTPTATPTPIPTSTTPAIIGLDAQIYEVRQVTGENIAQVQVNVLKQGTSNTPITVSYRFLDGTAHHTPLQVSLSDNYMAGDGLLSFQPTTTSLPITFFVMPTSSQEITYFTLNLYNLTGNAILSNTTSSALIYLNVNTTDPNVVLPQPGPPISVQPSNAPTTVATIQPQVTSTPTTGAPTTAPTPTITPTLTPTTTPTPTPHTNITTPPILTSASSHHDRDLGLGLGLGIGIPLICIMMLLMIWCIRRSQYTPVSVVEPPPKPTTIIHVQGKQMEDEAKQGNLPPRNNGFMTNIRPPTQAQSTTQPTKRLQVTFDTPAASVSASPESDEPHFHTLQLPSSTNSVTSSTAPLPRLHDDESSSGMDSHTDHIPDRALMITPTPTPTEFPLSSIHPAGPSSSYLRDTITPLRPVQPSVAERIHEMERQISFKQQQQIHDDEMDMKHNAPPTSMPPLETDEHMTLNAVTIPSPTSPPHRVPTPELLSQVQTKQMHTIL